ncbi:MAG: VWA domain-containing protein [Myxococcales bacterium]|nr:VWA domain-containing protein [Myxococcales bacterium]
MTSTRNALIVALLAGCAPIDNTVDYLDNIESFAQAPNNKVDILWVVDNSNSMEEEQAALATGFVAFASQLEASGTDFQIGVITTSFDYDDDTRGRLLGDPRWITNADDYESMFAERATSAGIGGADKEKGLEAGLYALSPAGLAGPGGYNEGFVRPEAQLLVIFVSDENDCSDGGALEGEAATACYTSQDKLTPVTSFVEDYRSLKPNEDDVSASSIVGTTSSTCSEVVEGTRYLVFTGLMGGLNGDICQANWAGMLGDLGLNATGIRTRFQLEKAAQPDTIEVTVDEVAVPGSAADGWTYDVESWYLEFHGSSVPERGAQITVSYTVDPGRSEPVTTAATE